MSTMVSFPEPKSPRAQFSEEVRVLMARRQIKQADLAVLLSIGQSEVSKRLRGTVAWQFDELPKLADYFEVSIGELFGEAPSNRGPFGGPGITNDGSGPSAGTGNSSDSSDPSTSSYVGLRLLTADAA